MNTEQTLLKRIGYAKDRLVPVTLAHPLKIVGRVVLGPRRIHNGYARIVAMSNGAGRIELFDTKSRSWSDASGQCTFDDVWSGAPILDSGYLQMLCADTDS